MSKIAFVFPGQGTQYVGMGKELYENSELAKKEFDSLFSKLDFDLKTVMFEGPEEALKETKNTQPAIVSMSLILTKLLEAKGVKPDYVAGHSVGEYAAFGAAGYLSTEDTVKLTSARGKFMNDTAVKVNGGMAAIIGLDSEKIKEVLTNVEGIVEAVNFNEPNQTVIAGQKDAIERACIALKEAGARRIVPLKVSGPFHSAMLEQAGEALGEVLDAIEVKKPEIPYVTNVTAQYVTKAEEVKPLLVKQVSSSVKWQQCVEAMIEDGVDTFVEIGPGKTLSGFMRKINRNVTVMNIQNKEEFETVVNCLK